MAIKPRPYAINKRGKKSHLVFVGASGWYDEDDTEVTRVVGSNWNWDPVKVIPRRAPVLVVVIKSIGPRYKKDRDVTDGTITVTLTNVTAQPPPTTVTYTDDPNA